MIYLSLGVSLISLVIAFILNGKLKQSRKDYVMVLDRYLEALHNQRRVYIKEQNYKKAISILKSPVLEKYLIDARNKEAAEVFNDGFV